MFAQMETSWARWAAGWPGFVSAGGIAGAVCGGIPSAALVSCKGNEA